MLGDIYDKKYQYELILYHPGTEQPISYLTYAYNITYKPQFAAIDELSFNLSYYIDDHAGQEVNSNYQLIKGDYLVLLNTKINEDIVEQQFFVVDSITDDGGDTDIKTINCLSRERTFKEKNVRGFKDVRKLYDPDNSFDYDDYTKGGILNYIIEEKLKNNWTVDYISPSLLNKYRSFDISDTDVLEVIRQIEQQYLCIFLYDTVNKKISIKYIDEIGENKGLFIDEKNYLNKINKNIDNKNIKTRLYIYGKNDATIAGINPTGQIYIDDFRYYRNLDYMNQPLLDAFNTYETLISSKTIQYESYQEELNTLREEMNDLKNNIITGLSVKLNDLVVYQSNEDYCIRYTTTPDGHDYTYWHNMIVAKTQEISNKQGEITAKQSQIDILIENIKNLQIQLSYESNFSDIQIKKIHEYIKEDSLTIDTNDERELYTFSKKILEKKAIPPIEFSVDIIDFLDSVEEQHSWRKLVLGDLINLSYEKLSTGEMELRLIGYTHCPDNATLTLQFSNKDYSNSEFDYYNDVIKRAYASAVTMDVERDGYNQYGEDSDSILRDGDTINTNTNTIILGDGSILDRRGQFMRDHDNALGQMRVVGSRIVFTNDNWNTISVGISSSGIVTSSLFTMTNTGGTVEINDNAIIATNMDFTLTNGVNTIYMNPNDGFKIKRYGVNQFYIDTDGNTTLDGKLKVTDNGIIQMSAYRDTFGGVVKVYNAAGMLNAKLGVQSGVAGNIGGTLVLYLNAPYDTGNLIPYQRVEMGISSEGYGGLTLRDESGNPRVGILAYSYDPRIGISDTNGVFVSSLSKTKIGFSDNEGNYSTYLSTNEGKINSEIIATQTWVNSQGYASASHTHSEFVTGDELYSVIEDHISQYHSS